MAAAPLYSHIVVLTSSRADWGIYLPLLKRLRALPHIHLHIIAFGTHLSAQHGSTITYIEEAGFVVGTQIHTTPTHFEAQDISQAIGYTTQQFAPVWAAWQPLKPLVFCLGDRYEMYAAVLATVPFQLTVAHIHGGETTLGAIDNIFRHSLSLIARYHFVAALPFAQRLEALLGAELTPHHIYTVGSLSLDNLLDLQLLDQSAFLEHFGIDLHLPTILCTYHPETVHADLVASHTTEVVRALKVLANTYQIVITMPNADTRGNVVREALLVLKHQMPNLVLVENLGTLGYFSCMQHCVFLVGNSSSGIIEAASLGKYVVNIGDRQLGRLCGDNVWHCPASEEAICQTAAQVAALGNYIGSNPYYQGNAANNIVRVVQELANLRE